MRKVLRSLRHAIQRPSGEPERVDFADHHIGEASRYLDPAAMNVLVVGCNTGDECRRFVRRGAERVVGVDVIDEIGADFSDPRVSYVRTSAEALDLAAAQFDLVYCFATMEHVARIDLAFPELVRVARPGGVIYSVAAPLWNSRVGHHKSELFEESPWIHLRLTRDQIVAECRRRGLTTYAGLPVEAHVDYMLNDAYFNKLPASDYLKACASLASADIIVNSLAYDADDDLTPDLESELGMLGYPREELLASVHTFVGRRR